MNTRILAAFVVLCFMAVQVKCQETDVEVTSSDEWGACTGPCPVYEGRRKRSSTPLDCTASCVKCRRPGLQNRGTPESPEFKLAIDCLMNKDFARRNGKAMSATYTYDTQKTPVRFDMIKEDTLVPDSAEPIATSTALLSVRDLFITSYHFNVDYEPLWHHGISLDYTVDPPEVLCDTPQLTHAGDHVTMNCSTDSYFTGFQCAFESHVNDVTSMISQEQVHHFPPSCVDSTFCITVCLMERPISGMAPGTYKFRVVMTDKLNFDDVVIRSELKLFASLGPPVILVNGLAIPNGYSKKVRVDEDMHVVCRIVGGTPGVSNVTLNCNGNEMTEDGDEVSKTLEVDTSFQARTCVCSGAHVSQAYSQTTNFTFDVQEPAIINSFTVGEETSEVVVSMSTNVDMVCQARGNPRPSLVLRRQRTREDIPATPDEESENMNIVTVTETMRMDDCTDTDTYECVASNGVGVEDVRTVQVSVRCPPSLVSPLAQQDVFEAEEGKPLEMEFAIYNHPAPYVFSLFKVFQSGNGGRRKREIAREAIASYLYKVNYTGSSTFSGKVKVLFNTVRASDGGNYVFHMSNNVEQPLEVQFVIKVDKDSDSWKDSMDTVTIAVPVVCVAVLLFTLFCWYCYHQRNKRRQEHGNDLALRDTIPNRLNIPHDDLGRYANTPRNDLGPYAFSNRLNTPLDKLGPYAFSNDLYKLPRVSLDQTRDRPFRGYSSRMMY